MSYLLKKVVDDDEEIVISKANIPVAKIIKYKKEKTIKRVGALISQGVIPDNFNEWSGDLAKLLGIKEV